MGELEFRDPLFLLAGLLAPVVFWLASRSPAVVSFSSLSIPDNGIQSLRARLTMLPALLMALSIIAIAIALAGPRTPDAQTKINREGIAIMMVVDRSTSMNARDLVRGDMSVDRLTVVKEVFRQFVLGSRADDGKSERLLSEASGSGRPDDAIGLIAFAGFADSLCPLTLDHGSLVSMLDDVQLVEMQSENGTAIGDGLGLAVERLRRSPAASKVVILLTDGVNNAGDLDPLKAAEVAAANNVKVYAIGAGTNGMAPVPAVGPFGRSQLIRMPVEIDEDTLRKIADSTGGKYFRATDIEALAGIYQQINELERTKITEFRYLQYDEHYGNFALLGLATLGLAVMLASTVFRTLP